MTEDEHELLTRVDERTKRIEESVKGWIETVKSDYVRKAEFQPIKLIVYGAVGSILLAVLTALLAMVIGGKITM